MIFQNNLYLNVAFISTYFRMLHCVQNVASRTVIFIPTRLLYFEIRHIRKSR